MSNENLIAVLEKSIRHINSGRLTSKAQVNQFVISPIIRALGWDQDDPDEFFPDYSTRPRVDFALCRAAQSPTVFIEVKNLGSINEAGEQQLFQYAHSQNAPLLVLTDGDVWDFCLSTAQGVLTQRRFYRARLTDINKISEHAERFNSFLRKENVLSGEAQRVAEKFHAVSKEQEKVKNAIPKVWRALLEKPDPDLRRLFAAAVDEACGITPDFDDLDSFFEEQLRDETGSVDINRRLPIKETQPKRTLSGSQQRSVKPRKHKIVGYVLNGRENKIGIANKTLIEIVKEFGFWYPEFMERFAANTIGKTRRLVARNREDLYDRKNLIKESVDLKNGWWLGTNLDNGTIQRHIKTACKTAGVKFGSQLTLITKPDALLEKQLRVDTQTNAANRQPPTRLTPSRQTKSSDSRRCVIKPPKSRIVGYVFDGIENQIGVGCKTLAGIVKEFSLRDDEFMPRFAAQTIGKRRRLVAHNRRELYDQISLSHRSIDLKNGWWIGKITTLLWFVNLRKPLAKSPA